MRWRAWRYLSQARYRGWRRQAINARRASNDAFLAMAAKQSVWRKGEHDAKLAGVERKDQAYVLLSALRRRHLAYVPTRKPPHARTSGWRRRASGL